jgi:protein-disulfide isomerase
VDDDPVKGSEDAPVTTVEFSDFECSFCARFFAETLPLIEESYLRTGKVRLIYRDYPVAGHSYAQKAGEAAECADEQGKFWDYHDMLFENQGALGTASLKQYAQDLGLDTARFNECLDSDQMAAEVQSDHGDGQAYGVGGTPTFFINGVKVVGAQPYEVFQQVIEQELKE